MTTEAGKRLLAEEWDNFDVKPWGSLADHVAAIEDEASRSVLDHIRDRIEQYHDHGQGWHECGWGPEHLAAMLGLIDEEQRFH